MRFLLSLGLLLLLGAGAKAGPDVSCKAHSQQTIFIEKGKKPREATSYIVDCTIKVNGKQIFGETLPERPATRAEAYQLMDEFIDKRAAEIIKGYTREKEK